MANQNTKIFAYKNQVYEELRGQYDSSNLFVDDVFPAQEKSLYYTKRAPKGCVWKRPHDICSNPQFIVNEISRFDLDQGFLGNCWFIAAASIVAQRSSLISFVIPQDQSFDNESYCGLFHFRFWQFGRWYDVVVDDLLPVLGDDRLVFCSNKTETNEFWPSLLEKAYAKLSWSYEGLDAGQTTDALIDMTGGIEETYNLKELSMDSSVFFNILEKSLAHDAMMGSSINASSNEMEARLSNGLVKGHAYSITACVKLNLNTSQVRLIRLRNPWGNDVEWNGSWCDRDPVWHQISAHDRAQLSVESRADGEFWMQYEDWLRNFDQIQICYLSPQTLSITGSQANLSYNSLQYDGELVPGHSAGGCGQRDAKKFWTNPQYLIRLQDFSGDGECTLIVALMQKYTRQKRMQRNGKAAEEFIQLRLYRVTSGDTQEGVKYYPKDLERIGTSGSYINKREVTYQCKVPPGNYIIIPSTYDEDREMKYLLRLFTESQVDVESIDRDKPDVEPDELEFHDGKGPEAPPQLKEWWENLPPEERERIQKMLGIAAVTGVAICCCIQILQEFFKQNEKEGEDEDQYALQ